MKKIWLINQYAMPPELESRLRTIKFAHYLTQKGYDVTVFASSFMHNTDINLIQDKAPYIEKMYEDIHFVHIKGIGYKKNGLKRLYSLIEFPLKFLRYYKKFEHPDIIIQTATVPFGNIIYKAAKKLKAKYITEVLDLWPETFVDLGMVSAKNPLVRLAYKAEKNIYKKSDAVVFSVEGGKDYIKDKRWEIESGGDIDLKKVFYINNGVDLEDFNYFVNNYKLEDPDLTNPSFKRVIYIGSMRLANNLKNLIEAAACLKDHKQIKFLLYGDGGDRNSLENYCKDNHLENVLFKQKWIEPKYVPYLLSCSDVNILNYMPGNFGKYGGSQSKLFQYMASGKPICSNLKMPYCPINKYNLGIAKEYKNTEEYADAIFSLINLNEKEKEEMNLRAKQIVKEFDYKNLTEKLISIF